MTHAHRPQTVVEQRLAHALPPPQDTPLRGCHHCGGAYLDCPDGRQAHLIVFGHQPARPVWPHPETAVDLIDHTDRENTQT